MEYKLPPLQTNLPNVVRRIRACEGEGAAQVVFEHALNEYAIAAIEAQVVPDGWTPTNAELTEIYKRANGENVGKAQPLTTQRIFKAMRAMLEFAPPAPQAKQCEWTNCPTRVGDKCCNEQASVAQQEPVAKILSAGDLRGKVEWLVHSGRPISIGQFLYTHPAQQALTPCNCRWDGEKQVQQCTLHKAHVDAIHEWAERAKTAEKTLSAQQAKPQPLRDEQILASNFPDGEENGPIIAAPDFELLSFARQIEAAHGIQGS